MIFLAVLALLMGKTAASIASICDSYVTNKYLKKIWTIVFYTGCISLFVGVLVLLFFGVPEFVLSFKVYFLLFIIALLTIIFAPMYFLALKTTDTSVISAIQLLGKVFTPILAFFMIGEKLSLMKYIGFGIIILINFILNIEKVSGKIKINKGFWLMLSVSFILVIQSILTKKALMYTDWVSVSFWKTTFTTLLLFGSLAFKTLRNDIVKSFSIYKTKFKTFFSIELFACVNEYFTIFALSVLPVVVVSSFEALRPMITMIIGIILRYLFKIDTKEIYNKREVLRRVVFYLLLVFGVIITVLG